MTIILDSYAIPERGRVEVRVNASFEIKVTAEEAQRRVDRWLLEHVSTQMGADPPTLVVGERVVWRVPAYISFPHSGRAGVVAALEVDVETGEMNNTPERQAEIEQRAQEIAARQPPFRLKEVPPEYRARNVPPAPILDLEDQAEPDAAAEA